MRRAVAAFRVWLHEKAGGDVGWAKGATSADLPPKLSRDQLLSRWDRHTKDCASCKQVTLSTSPDMSMCHLAKSSIVVVCSMFGKLTLPHCNIKPDLMTLWHVS